MTVRIEDAGRGRNWRALAWGGAAALILLPLVAMQFTREVNWGPGDFGLAIALVGAVGGTFELAVRASRSWTYRAGIGVALAAVFLLVWINLAVGIIGSEENPANLMYFGVVAIAGAGAALARFRAEALARAMVATAIAQAGVFAVALIAGFGFTGPVTIVFCGLWLLSAWLLRRAATEQAGAAVR